MFQSSFYLNNAQGKIISVDYSCQDDGNNSCGSLLPRDGKAFTADYTGIIPRYLLTHSIAAILVLA
jgi:hypothetical protein